MAHYVPVAMHIILHCMQKVCVEWFAAGEVLQLFGGDKWQERSGRAELGVICTLVLFYFYN